MCLPDPTATDQRVPYTCAGCVFSELSNETECQCSISSTLSSKEVVRAKNLEDGSPIHFEIPRARHGADPRRDVAEPPCEACGANKLVLLP